MRLLLLLVVLVLIGGAIATFATSQVHPGAAGAPAPAGASQMPASMATWANPRGGVLHGVERAVQGAQHQVLVLGDLHDAGRITAALMDAHERGVEVQLVAPAPDPSTDRWSLRESQWRSTGSTSP